MTKPFATAIIKTAAYSPFGTPVDIEVEVRKSHASNAATWFYAPNWRKMAFVTIEAAKAKLERHPGFVRWAA